MGEAPPAENMKSPSVQFGPWDYTQEVVDWEKIMAERDQKVKEQEAEKNKRVELANRLEKSWELIRISKKVIKEQGQGWQESKEKREQQRKLEVERADRLKRAEKGREEVIRKTMEDKILKLTSMLPSQTQTRLETEESRRILIQETKTNLWKKWRGGVPPKKNTNNWTRKLG